MTKTSHFDEFEVKFDQIRPKKSILGSLNLNSNFEFDFGGQIRPRISNLMIHVEFRIILSQIRNSS